MLHLPERSARAEGPIRPLTVIKPSWVFQNPPTRPVSLRVRVVDLENLKGVTAQPVPLISAKAHKPRVNCPPSMQESRIGKNLGLDRIAKHSASRCVAVQDVRTKSGSAAEQVRKGL